MLHSKHLTLLAGKTEAQATRAKFKVNQGVIYRVWVTFPAGCAGLVKLRMYHEGHPFLPVDKDAYISGDSYVFEYPIFFEIKHQPEIITVEAWNTDEVYDHNIDIQFLIIPKEWVQPVGAYEGIIASMRSIFVPNLREI